MTVSCRLDARWMDGRAHTLLATKALSVLLLAVTCAVSQGPDLRQQKRSLDDQIIRMQAEADAVRGEHAEQRAAQYRQQQLIERARDFQSAWIKLWEKAETWNPKQAAAVEKAFDKLTHAEGWLSTRKK